MVTETSIVGNLLLEKVSHLEQFLPMHLYRTTQLNLDPGLQALGIKSNKA